MSIVADLGMTYANEKLIFFGGEVNFFSIPSRAESVVKNPSSCGVLRVGQKEGPG